jgi:hypothetical protein
MSGDKILGNMANQGGSLYMVGIELFGGKIA